MDMQQIIENARENIWQCLDDYGAHTYQTDVLTSVSDDFVDRLATDSSYAKQELRELFSKSPVYDAELDALVINGTRTHNPDYDRIHDLAYKILSPVINTTYDQQKYTDLIAVINFFVAPNDDYAQRTGIEALNRLAPKAYTPTKKRSRVFKSLCQALGIADETAGSDFQRDYAQFADELSAKKIGFKLYVSINPAHFISMSNPKSDDRGNCLTSCHSFNSTEYEYNNGCTGYARDNVTFIVFTAADPTNPETLNNRKTTRQIFAYKPGNGVLLQSRMYNTSGGTRGAQEESVLYRDLVQREISMLEGAVNLWHTYSSTGDNRYLIEQASVFGGYADWTFTEFDGHISIRDDMAEYSPLRIGAAGLCICCGSETSYGLYCDDCREDGREQCDECGNYFDEDDLYNAYNRYGESIRICDECRSTSYSRCDDCDELYPDSSFEETYDGRQICPDCMRDYQSCDRCGKLCNTADIISTDDGEKDICPSCFEDAFFRCDSCGGVHSNADSIQLIRPRYRQCICQNCSEGYSTCPECGELVVFEEDGTCPSCGVAAEKEETA